jgi:nicotinate-nucleotide adenylyltransferase
MASRIGRIGLFGGSFDPIHTGHLIAAQAAVNTVGLERVFFIPTARPPHKRARDLTRFDTRRRMVELAIEGNPRFELSLIEAGRGVSYTYRSILSFVERGFRRDEIHLLIGADSFEEMETWRRTGEIVAHATILVMARPGHERFPALPPDAALVYMTAGSNSISSSDIRRLVRERKPIRYLVPDRIERFIAEHSLYVETS